MSDLAQSDNAETGSLADMAAYRRGDIVDCVVTGHAHWGVLFTMPGGEPGWIEGDYLDDVKVPPEKWPAEGTVVRAVVLDHLPDGRWWLSARPSRPGTPRENA